MAKDTTVKYVTIDHKTFIFLVNTKVKILILAFSLCSCAYLFNIKSSLQKRDLVAAASAGKTLYLADEENQLLRPKLAIKSMIE